MAQELRRAAADQKYGVVAGGFRLAKRNISLDEVTGAFNVGVPLRLEIVNDSVEAFLFGRPNMRRPSLFLKTMFRVENLVGFPGVVSDNQDFT